MTHKAANPRRPGWVREPFHHTADKVGFTVCSGVGAGFIGMMASLGWTTDFSFAFVTGILPPAVIASLAAYIWLVYLPSKWPPLVFPYAWQALAAEQYHALSPEEKDMARTVYELATSLHPDDHDYKYIREVEDLWTLMHYEIKRRRKLMGYYENVARFDDARAALDSVRCTNNQHEEVTE